jgi:transglutaminase-like putative cysteine protease
MANNFGRVIVLAALCSCVVTGQARAQQQQAPEDPEDDKKLGLWLDQGISTGLTPSKSLEIEFHERLDEGISNLYEYFVQGGIAFRVRPWLTVAPLYRYQRFPGNPAVAYENRLLLNVTMSTLRGAWRPNLRTMVEGRFPDNRTASARFRVRPGIDYTLPLPMKRRPVLVVSNEFFFVPGTNSFAAGGSFTQNRFQVGVRLPITDSFSIRPYYLLQSVNLPTGWETNEIIGISLAAKFLNKNK